MKDSLYIAWRYVCYNRGKTFTLIACVTLVAFLPLALEVLLNQSQKQFVSRAAATPLLIGAKGSALDLVMNSLYFDDEVPEQISMAAADEVADTGLALPIPVYARFEARGQPIVGTTLDYFEQRGLQIAGGRQLAVLGDAVLGADAAAKLGLAPGDNIVSSPENLFDLAGVYPLKMPVVGVLEKSHSPDDRAVFVDLKTAWVIQGLGHGHQDLKKISDQSVILESSKNKITANAKLLHYTEIDQANRESFHFHGDMSQYPVTAVIAMPNDSKSATILRGRYLTKGQSNQIVQPLTVIDGLLQNIFRIKNVLDAVIGVVAFATVLALILVFVLSLRLRQREVQTMYKLGCAKMTVAKLLSAEIVIIAAASAGLCGLMIVITTRTAPELVRLLFVG